MVRRSSRYKRREVTQKLGRTIRLPEKLNWNAAAETNASICALEKAAVDEGIILDLSKVNTSYPDGMLAVLTICEHHRKKGTKLSFVVPSDKDVRRFMESVRFLHYLSPEDFSFPRHRHTSQYHIYQFESYKQQDDAVSAVMDVCLKELAFAEGVPLAFEWALNEIAGNVLDHSELDRGYMQVVAYRKTSSLSLVVADAGVGIRKSLSKAHKVNDDKSAIELALRQGVTGRPKENQGNGLYGALGIAEHSGNYFSVASGTSKIEVQSGSLRSRGVTPPFQGTTVSMRFATDREVDIRKALGGHQPRGHLEARFENDDGDMVFVLRDYASNFGNRGTGRHIYHLIYNMIRQHPGKSIRISMEKVPVVSSSFADEVFGKLFVLLGATDYNAVVRLANVSPVCKDLIDQAISQRIVQDAVQALKAKA